MVAIACGDTLGVVTSFAVVDWGHQEPIDEVEDGALQCWGNAAQHGVHELPGTQCIIVVQLLRNPCLPTAVGKGTPGAGMCKSPGH